MAGDDVQLVEQVRRGESAAFAPLFERWHDRVFNVARGVVRDTEVAADVTQDVFLAAWQQLDQLEDADAFGGWLLRIARNKALNTLQRERRSTPLEGDTVTALHDHGLPDPAGASRSVGTPELAEAHDRQELLWAAAAALGERDASVLDLHLRHGLTAAELADDLGVEPNNAHQLLFRLRKRLEDAIGAFLLWRHGMPTCPQLRGIAGRTFDADQAASIRRHERTCERCQEERQSQTRPAALFAAVPLMVVPLALRARTAYGLESAGVPMPADLTAGRDVTPDGGPGGGEHGDGSDGASEDDDPGRGDGESPAAGAGGAGGGGDDGAAPDHGGTGNTGGPRRRGWVIAVMAGAAVLILVIAFIVAGDEASAPGDEPAVPIGAASTSSPSTSTPPSTVPTTLAATTTAPATTAVRTTAVRTTAATTTTLVTPATTRPILVATPSPTEPPPPNRPEPTTTPRPDPEPTQPPVGEDPGTTAPEPTRPAEPPPAILRYSVDTASHQCEAGLNPYIARWLTENAASATLSWSGVTDEVAVSDARELCLQAGEAVTLTVTGADGQSTSATETAPEPPVLR